MRAIRPLCASALVFFACVPAALPQIPRDPTPVVSKNSPEAVAMGGIIRGGIPGTGMNGFGSLNAEETGQIIGYLRTLGHTADAEIAKGDAARGKSVYDTSSYGSCHIISGEGGGVGPELTRVGAMRGPATCERRC
jgi:mono/diheme cytochrome c family protein